MLLYSADAPPMPRIRTANPNKASETEKTKKMSGWAIAARNRNNSPCHFCKSKKQACKLSDGRYPCKRCEGTDRAHNCIPTKALALSPGKASGFKLLVNNTSRPQSPHTPSVVTLKGATVGVHVLVQPRRQHTPKLSSTVSPALITDQNSQYGSPFASPPNFDDVNSTPPPTGGYSGVSPPSFGRPNREDPTGWPTTIFSSAHQPCEETGGFTHPDSVVGAQPSPYSAVPKEPEFSDPNSVWQSPPNSNGYPQMSATSSPAIGSDFGSPVTPQGEGTGRTNIPGSWIRSYGSTAYFHTGGNVQYPPYQMVPQSSRSEDAFSYTRQPAHHAQSFPTELAQVVGESFVQHQIGDVVMSPGVPPPPGTTDVDGGIYTEISYGLGNVTIGNDPLYSVLLYTSQSEEELFHKFTRGTSFDPLHGK